MDNVLSNIIKTKQTCIFISPHLDDAMLSAGGLIHYLSSKTKVIVINVFTESSDDKQTLSAWKFVKDMGYKKPSILFKERRNEDQQAFSKMHIVPINLGFSDALWRKKKGLVPQLLGNFLPEFAHAYPTYRFHMTKGKLAKADRETITEVSEKLQTIIDQEKKPLIFCPLGVGNHVDHRLTRQVCEQKFSNRVYWSDFPYNIRENKDGTPPQGYFKATFPVKINDKRALIMAYKTQVSGLFSDGIIPDHKEIFFLAKK